MKSHIPHEMEHDVGVNKLQLHHGASNSLTSEQMFPLLTNEREGSQNLQHETNEELPELLDYASYLIHLAVFGILGVGSFLMGWFGVVFKQDISNVSEYLAVALTTGYLGSLTTFSGWNQKMLELGVTGNWLFAVLGYLIGLFLVAFSIIFGIETAKGFKWLLRRPNTSSRSETSRDKINVKVKSFKKQLVVMVVLLLVLGFLWCVSGVLMISEFKNDENSFLWIACIVGPLGVWIRWLLAPLNRHGLGSRGLLNWIPFGTLIANVSAACIMAALATTKIYVNTRDCDTIIKGIQFGLLGCLSTVSTFVAEFNEMRESMHPWRAYVYTVITICSSFFLGILIFCIPIWRIDDGLRNFEN
ncbi:fluoride export protein 1 isoform X4 [Lathyrus oleraceus]|uniref:fluoride export protein 1 isoform X4 n=1 Tax=Pisum sativum TaxID=3888 RepID=UPI0021CFAEF2|nr:fluoride export protein 1-like isoform X4 [Pisum sativum]